jgi:hypothetical protein
VLLYFAGMFLIVSSLTSREAPATIQLPSTRYRVVSDNGDELVLRRDPVPSPE